MDSAKATFSSDSGMSGWLVDPFGRSNVNDVHPLCAFSTTPHYKGSSACSRGRDREETQPTLRVHARSAKNQHILVVVPASLDVAK